MLNEYDWKSTNFPKILQILTGIPGKPFKFLWNSGIPQDFESAGSGILQRLQLSFLEILKFLGTQFSVVHGGGVDIFWNSPFRYGWSNMADIWDFSAIFLGFEPRFFLNGGTSQNSVIAEAKYRCNTKTFHSSLEGWALLWSNMADPIWPILEVFGHFFNFHLHFF